MTKLNGEQQKVKRDIFGMQAGDRLVVSGRAGSGKTYAIAHSVSGRKALFLTPTHPARNVLESELTDGRHLVTTIHSAIGWRKHRNEELKKVDSYLPAWEAKQRVELSGDRRANPFAEADIIIVDEFSMVGSFLFGAVEEYANAFGKPVVYSGDRFQLPPVKGREVIVDQGFKTITLNSSVRFARDSDTFRYGEELRYAIEFRPYEDLPCLYNSQTVQVVSASKWMSLITHGYEDGEDLLVVSADNATQKRLRKQVRQVDHVRFCDGDRVISKQTDDLFRNGEQFTIGQIEPASRVLPDVPGCVSQSRKLTVNGHQLAFQETGRTAFVLEDDQHADKLSTRICRLHEEGDLDHAEACRILDWLDEINRFELTALATVHKSQGRSVDTVYIDTSTVLKRPTWLSPRNHKRLLYTAVTRARKNVVFYEVPTYCSRASLDWPKVA